MGVPAGKCVLTQLTHDNLVVYCSSHNILVINIRAGNTTDWLRTKKIKAGEEVLVSYGRDYWADKLEIVCFY